MRIISGKYRSRKLHTSEISKKAGSGPALRPTSDRAKQMLFDILANRIDFEGITCLDLFAGTGSLGFECLSRGAEVCHFADYSAESENTILKTAAELGCLQQVKFIRRDVIACLSENEKKHYDLILADPPYTYDQYGNLINTILKRKFGIFVLEYRRGTGLDAEAKEGIEIIDREAGLTAFKIFIST